MSTAKDLDRLLKKFVDRGLPGAALSVMQGDKRTWPRPCR